MEKNHERGWQGTDTKGKASGPESRALFKVKSKNQGGNKSRLEDLSTSNVVCGGSPVSDLGLSGRNTEGGSPNKSP